MRFSWAGNGCFPTGKHYPGIAHLLRIAASGLAQEFDSQTALHELPMVSIDTETTGRDWHTDRIVEVACVVYRGGQIVAKHDWLVNPGCPIPKEAFDVHGISDDDVKDKPSFEGIAEELLTVLEDAVPIAYNAEFDREFIHKELERANARRDGLPPGARKGVRWMDPLTWARELHKDEKSKSLGAMAELLNVELENAHRATDDAVAAVLVLAEFFKDIRVPKTYGAFIQEQQRLERLQAEQRQYWRS